MLATVDPRLLRCQFSLSTYLLSAWCIIAVLGFVVLLNVVVVLLVVIIFYVITASRRILRAGSLSLGSSYGLY
jgi:hypothetical protein